MSEEKKEAAPAPAADKKAAPKKGGALGLILFMTVAGAMAPFMLPTLILCVGMFPTVIALFTDNDRSKTSLTAVGAMNVAGVTPFIIDLWQKGQTMENALAILNEPQTWVVMLGAAAVGQMIVFAIPQAIASMTVSRMESRAALLKENLETLKRIWGPEVATTKPLERVRRGE
jgi:hypothetical protein